MKQRMAEAVASYEAWEPDALSERLALLQKQIRALQSDSAAIMKAMRRQRKSTKRGGDDGER